MKHPTDEILAHLFETIEAAPVNDEILTPLMRSIMADPVMQSRMRELNEMSSVNSDELIATSKQAGEAGLQAMTRIAEKIVRKDNDGAVLMRSMLLSLYTGGLTVDLSQVQYFDSELRNDLCVVILGLNRGEFDDHKIRDMLIAAGDTDAKWFLAGLPHNKEEDVV